MKLTGIFFFFLNRKSKAEKVFQWKMHTYNLNAQETGDVSRLTAGFRQPGLQSEFEGSQDPATK